MIMGTHAVVGLSEEEIELTEKTQHGNEPLIVISSMLSYPHESTDKTPVTAGRVINCDSQGILKCFKTELAHFFPIWTKF